MNQQFTGQTNSFALIQNTGGLNSTASPLTVTDNEATDLQNVDLDLWGRIMKRLGYLNLNSEEVNSGAGCTGHFYFELPDGTDYLVATFGNKIYKMDDLDGTFDDITGAATITDYDTYKWQFKVYNSTLLGTNNVNVPLKWTGSGNVATWTLPALMTRCKTLEIWNDFTFVGNVTVDGIIYPSRFYWSSPGTTETWDSADWINVNKDDGQEIICLKALGDKLVIFKERNIYLAGYTGDTNIPFVVYKTPSHVGTIARDSVQEVSNGLIFLSYDGWYYFDGSNSVKISDKINYTVANDLASSSLQYATSIVNRSKNQYLCFLTEAGSSTNSMALVYDFYNKAWYKYDGLSANVACNVYVDGEERVYFGDYSGFSYRLGTGNSDYPLGVKTAINAYYKTKWFNFGELMNQKAVPHIVVYLKYDNSTLNIGYSWDFEDVNQRTLTQSLASSASVYGSSVYGASTYAGSGGFPKRIDLTGRGRVLRLSFENSTEDEAFTINGFGFSAYQETHV